MKQDINEDIKIVEEIKDMFIHLKNYGWINDIKKDIDTDKAIIAIENILKERQEDKEKIKELEEEKGWLLEEVNYLDEEKWIDFKFFVDSLSKTIPKSKIKEKIEEYFEDEEWLVEHDLRALCDDEKECREYYTNKKIALKDIKKAILDKLDKLLKNY